MEKNLKHVKTFTSFVNESKLNEGLNNSDCDQYIIYCRDTENQLKELIEYIAQIGNIGHSFSIVVDPNDSDYEKTFGWDGDGSDYIKELKVVQKKSE
mgnify:CR=1 FL=1